MRASSVVFATLMLAAAGAAIAYQPARSWLTDRANRVVYGERVSPDEALRTWGARLTRAIPLDELLLQLAEALRKSMQLYSAQIWVGADGHYEVAAMVPHRAVKPFAVGERERAVVSRATWRVSSGNDVRSAIGAAYPPIRTPRTAKMT